jgi:hypothetical protein
MQTHEREQSIPYLTSIKQKKAGKIMGHGCADGRKLRHLMNKVEVGSPTLAMESAFLTSVIATKENQEVETIDIPGAFIQADMDEPLVHVQLDGPVVELLAQIEPRLYRKFIIAEHGK